MGAFPPTMYLGALKMIGNPKLAKIIETNIFHKMRDTYFPTGSSGIITSPKELTDGKANKIFKECSTMLANKLDEKAWKNLIPICSSHYQSYNKLGTPYKILKIALYNAFIGNVSNFNTSETEFEDAFKIAQIDYCLQVKKQCLLPEPIELLHYTGFIKKG
jgi:hypothetical protein